MKSTPLHACHVELGARLVEFGGWHMPVQYASILDEVRAVRTAVGLFDLSHMGRLSVEGADALRLVERVASNHCARIPIGSIRYALLLGEDGFPLDDILIYREQAGVYLVVNASNTERDLDWTRRHAGGLDARVLDRTAAEAMIALQGPRSQEVLQRVVAGFDLAQLKYYRFGFASVCGLPHTRISRTGYTGEDGFELYFPAAHARDVWNALLEVGRASGIQPIGLGARDTLRLEAGMPLYGHEIDAAHHPLEAGLGFGVALTPEKGDFVGRAALERLARAPARRLVGITTQGPRVPRQGHALFQGGEQVGEVCSGSVSPTLETNIGSAYVRLGCDRPGTSLELDVRGKRQACAVVELPFYSRTRKKNS
jgi:aminomethyltransferase